MCWPCVPSSPLLPGALCSGDVLLSPSSLVRPHAPVLAPPANFPPRGYIAGSMKPRPSPLCLSGLATVLPPIRRELPGGICPTLPQGSCLHRNNSGSALPVSRDCLLAGMGHDAAAISLCCGPVACSPPWAVPSCDGESFILGACAEAVAQPRRPIRYAAVRLLPRPVLPRLV